MRRMLLPLFVAVMLIFVACGDDEADQPAETAATSATQATTAATVAEETPTVTDEPEAPAAAGDDLPTIRLAVNPWNGSVVNVEVAKQLLEGELGYTVETVDIDENAQWSAINTGDLHASLEVWPSGHAQNVADFIDNPDGNVVNAGLLGPVGKIGWFTPTFVIEQYPAAATWEGFLDPELAGMFATAETGDKGQFLGGDPSWVQYDDDIIANLGLHLEVVWAGSEEAILAAIDASVAREEPVLVYFWTPHSAFNAYDLSEVELPAYSDECYATADDDGVDCAYPADDLFKIVWAGLEEAAPTAWALLHNMNYTTADQISMLAAVESEGKSIEQAASEWIAANESTWGAWLSGEMAEPAMAMSAEKGDLGTIRLAVNPWNGSAVNVAVAKQLLESEFGYTVETVDIDENAQWSAINTGDLHASLEVWPSGHAQNVTDFIDNPDGNVANLGLLGPVGAIGWFTPTFVVEQYPALATWEGYLDPELAGMFATAETGDKGQFLGGDPSWVQYDDDIIANLGLHLEVVWAGSEEAILAAVDASISREEPVLVYFWTPHSAFNAYDLTQVELPAYSDECYATADDDGVDCAYPADPLFKIAWEGLEEAAPAAWALLHNMSYTTADQIFMLAAVESEGKSVEEAAAAWIAANESTWSAWLP